MTPALIVEDVLYWCCVRSHVPVSLTACSGVVISRDLCLSDSHVANASTLAGSLRLFCFWVWFGCDGVKWLDFAVWNLFRL